MQERCPNESFSAGKGLEITLVSRRNKARELETACCGSRSIMLRNKNEFVLEVQPWRIPCSYRSTDYCMRTLRVFKVLNG